MNSPSNQPLFLIPKGHFLVHQYRQWFEQIRQNPKQHLRIVIENEFVKQKIVAPYQELFLALQHYPDLLEHLIFSLEFVFEKPGRSKERYEGHEWKGEEAIQWLFQLNESFPATVFLLNDNDARFFALMGDLIKGKELIIVPIKEEMGRTFLNNEQMNILSQRVFNHSCFFLMFCHGSGFNPEKYIDSLIADYGLPFTYEQVHEIYMEKVNAHFNNEEFASLKTQNKELKSKKGF